MQNVASKLEKLMEMCLSLNVDIAHQETYIKELEDKLSILNTLKEVNYYMGAELELEKVIQIIIDVVMGVLGVTTCSICLLNENAWDIKEHTILDHHSELINSSVVDKLNKELKKRNGEIIIQNLNGAGFLNLEEGSLFAISLMRGNNDYGIITIYYNAPEAISDRKQEFFRLVSTQLRIQLENAYLYEKIKMASISDGLTGLFNRLHLNDILHREDALNVKEMSMIMMDIDSFKKVNDTYGHIFGDEVIKALAALLKKLQKTYNLKAFRYGGEEFLVLSDCLSLDEVCQVAETIRTSFNTHDFFLEDGNSVQFSISLGVSKFGYSTKVLDPVRLIDIADEALYYSKKNGKNRYTVSSSDLQLYTKSIELINKAAAKHKRSNHPFILLKGSFDLKEGISKTGYNEFTTDIGKIFRIYDVLIFNETGGFLCILEDARETETIKTRVMEALKDYRYSCSDLDVFVYENDLPDLLQLLHLD